MKRYINFYLMLVLFILIGFFAAWGMYALVISNIEIPFKTFATIICGIALFAVIFLLYFELKEGKAYYEYLYIPIADVQKQMYKNYLTITIDDYIYPYTYRKDKLDELTEIKAIQYYSLKKKPVAFIPIPYDQIK